MNFLLSDKVFIIDSTCLVNGRSVLLKHYFFYVSNRHSLFFLEKFYKSITFRLYSIVFMLNVEVILLRYK